MIRLTLAFALTIAACAKEEPAASGLAAGTFKGGDRDALCISGPPGAQRAGFIVYGADDANCSASGRIAPERTGWALIPAGDAECKIAFRIDADRITLASAPPNCAYYCGPGANLADKSFTRSGDTKPVNDLAGDPLC